jgi:hypothetical protein
MPTPTPGLAQGVDRETSSAEHRKLVCKGTTLSCASQGMVAQSGERDRDTALPLSDKLALVVKRSRILPNTHSTPFTNTIHALAPAASETNEQPPDT